MFLFVISLLMIPVYVGYFIATIFMPLVFILAIILIVVGSAVWPLYMLVKKIVAADLRIDDPSVLAIGIMDKKNALIDFSIEFPQFFGPNNKIKVFGRREIGDLLVKAQSNISPMFQLRVMKCYDSIEQHNDDASCIRQVMNHNTGAAIDVNLVNQAGECLAMGNFDFMSEEIGRESDRLKSKRVSHVIRQNREILSKSLSSVGFVNNPYEWWHWSFGDQYWALVNRAHHADFGPIVR